MEHIKTVVHAACLGAFGNNKLRNIIGYLITGMLLFIWGYLNILFNEDAKWVHLATIAIGIGALVSSFYLSGLHDVRRHDDSTNQA